MHRRIISPFLFRRFESKSSCIFLLFALFFSSLNCFGQTSEAVTLELNKSIERKLPGGSEIQTYQINLAADQYAKIVVEQLEADVSVKLFGTDGNYLTTFNSEIRHKQNENIEFVVSQAGNYLVKIQPASKNETGLYRINLIEKRDATERERRLFEARMLLEKASGLRLAGKYDESLALASRSLEIAEKESGGEPVLVARILQESGVTQMTKGNYQAALSALQRAYSISEKVLGKEHPQTLESYQSLALYHHKVRDYAKSEKIYREISDFYERSSNKDYNGLANILINFGSLLNDLGDTVQAESVLKRSVGIIEKYLDSNDVLMRRTVNNLGITYLIRREYEASGQYFQKALEIYEKNGETGSLEYSNSLINRGIIYVNRKDYVNALAFYERSLTIRYNLLDKDHPENAILLNNIGNVYKSLGNYDKAMEFYGRAREIGEKSVGPLHRSMLLVIANIAKIYAAQGDISNAVAYQKLWDERFEQTISAEMIIGSERQKLAYSNAFESRTSRTISLHLNLAKNNQAALDLGALVVLQRKGRVLDAVAENLTALRERATEKDKELLDGLNKISAGIAKLALNKPTKISLEEYRRQLADLEEKKEKIEREISSLSADLSVHSPAVTLESIKAKIPDDAALIEFAVYRPYDSKAENNNEAYSAPRYVAYIIRKNAEVKCRDLGDKETIDKAIENLRIALRSPERKDVQPLARLVDEKVMQTIRSLSGTARHLLISPDGELNLIPFQALVDENGRYLVENYSFDYLTSGRDLLRMGKPQASKSNSLIIADPAFNKAADNKIKQVTATESNRRSITAAKNLSDTYFAPLAGTLAEAHSIRDLFPGWKFLTGAEATEAALKQTIAPRILHIATHGFFLQEETGANSQSTAGNGAGESETENPLLRSGLALAGANQRSVNKGDDGILTALEVSALNLWGTKLVVLSACDTGLGEVKNGEGVYGLRRAFTLAGSESLVMSLWSVSDYVTREIMTDYYKNLKKGVGRGDSLRKVQLEMLKKPNRQHPFYWASFIQSGEWTNLDGKR